MLLNPTLDKELPHKIISVCDYLIINVISRSARRWLPKNCRWTVKEIISPVAETRNVPGCRLWLHSIFALRTWNSNIGFHWRCSSLHR